MFRAVRAAEALCHGVVEIVAFHVNDEAFPRIRRPPSEACTWKERLGKGDVAAAILDAAQAADLIVMATKGRHGVVDALRGSVTEGVVRAGTANTGHGAAF